MNIFHLLAMKNINKKVMEVFYQNVPKVSDLLNAKDRHGRTPLHYKLMYSTNHTQDFLEHGAKVEIGSSNKEKDELAPTLVIAMKSWLSITKADEIDEEERLVLCISQKSSTLHPIYDICYCNDCRIFVSRTDVFFKDVFQ